MRALGTALIAVGALLVLIGLLAWAGALSWFGRLPGDIRIERPNLRVYVPLTSMLLVSLIATLVMTVLRRLRG